MRLRAAVLAVALSIAAAAAAQQSTTPLPTPDVKSAPPSEAQKGGQATNGNQGQGTQANQSPGNPAGGLGGFGENPMGGSPLGGMGSLDTSSSSGPVEIDAEDGIEWNRDDKTYIARGHARAARGDLSIAADTLTAHYRDSADGQTAIYMVEADGNVVVLSKDSKIVGDKAIYDLDKGSAVITGKDLKATSKANYVTARDSMEYWTKQGAVVARGKAVAADESHRVDADMLVGYFRTDDKGQKKMYQVEATGNVRLDNNGNIAFARRAVYNLDTDIATLDGGVKITRGKNQLNGEHAVYNAKTGQAKITGGKGGKVKTLLVPGSDKGDQSLSGALKP